jgi:hypothetical protein
VTKRTAPLAALFLLFAAIGIAGANDIYVAQSAQGANTGTSCANAYAYTFFNAASNWGSGASQIGSGTTVHICGIITATSGANLFTFQKSGSSSAYVTLYFESSAVLEAPYFGTGPNAAIYLNNQSYVLVDGGSNGTIENTLNGTSGASCIGGPCSYQQSSLFIEADCSNCEIRNLSFVNNYLRTSLSDLPNLSQDGCIFSDGYHPHNNMKIDNNTAHDVRYCMTFQWGGSSGSSFAFYNNTVTRANGMLDLSGCSNGTDYDTVKIYGNTISNFAVWDDSTGGEKYHHDGIHLYACNASSASVSNLAIYNNSFEGPVGSCCMTAPIYLENEPNTATLLSGYIFNNTFTYSVGDCKNTCGNGMINPQAGTTTVLVANNTLYGDPANQNGVCYNTSTPVSGLSIVNNVMTGCGELISISSALMAAQQPDYNVYANSGSSAFVCNGNFYSAAQFSSWKSCIGADAHSSYQSSAKLNSDLTLQAGSPAIGAASNLSSQCVGVAAPLCTDKVGNARPTSGAWDAGAFVYSANAGQPNPPSGLYATVN